MAPFCYSSEGRLYCAYTQRELKLLAYCTYAACIRGSAAQAPALLIHMPYDAPPARYVEVALAKACWRSGREVRVGREGFIFLAPGWARQASYRAGAIGKLGCPSV